MMNIIKSGTIYHFFRKAEIVKNSNRFCEKKDESRTPEPLPALSVSGVKFSLQFPEAFKCLKSFSGFFPLMHVKKASSFSMSAASSSVG